MNNQPIQPTISVPEGATVTFSGDGQLFAKAIGTKGYYRDGKDHHDQTKTSGTVNISGTVHITASSAYGAGIGGGAINGSTCEQAAFNCGAVNIGQKCGC